MTENYSQFFTQIHSQKMLKIHNYFYNFIDFFTIKFTKNIDIFCEFLNILGFPLYMKNHSQKLVDFTQKNSQKS